MVGPLDAVNGVAAIITLGISYIQNNAWAILLLLAVGHVVKTKGMCVCLCVCVYCQTQLLNLIFKFVVDVVVIVAVFVCVCKC